MSDQPTPGKPKLIGLAGPRRAGKDTVGRHLEEVFGFHSLHFAAPIKRGLSAMFSVPIEWFYDEERKEAPHPCLCGRSPRHLMETLGTEWAQHCIGSTVWSQIVEQEIGYLRHAGQGLIVVTDVRFPHEAEMIKRLGGEIWEITGRGSAYDDGHISRARLSESYFSAMLRNNHSLRMLYAQVGVEIARIDRGY